MNSICDKILTYLDGDTKITSNPKSAPSTYKIVSWNVLREPEHFPWNERRDRVFEILESFRADFISLQEVYEDEFKDDFGEFIARGWGYVVQTRTGSGQRNWSAILYRKNRFQVLHEIHRSAGLIVEFLDSEYPELGAFHICVLHLNGGKTGLEFGSKCAFTRYAQVRGLLSKGLQKRLGQNNQRPPALIVCGDFNCEYGAAPHEMLRSGKLTNNFLENGLSLSSKIRYNTGWILKDVYDGISPRPTTFCGFFDYDGGGLYQKECEAIKQMSRYHSSKGHFDKNKFISFTEYESFMKSERHWCFTQDWNPKQNNRNWFCERDIIDLIVLFAYGDMGLRVDKLSLDYIYYNPKEFQKIDHTLPATPELEKYSFDTKIRMPNDRNPSDHFPISITLKRCK